MTREHVAPVECPVCGTPSLQQARVRVFPFDHGTGEVGCSVIEQPHGSTLTLRESDMIHPRPGDKNMPAITITYRCDYCVMDPRATIEMHICRSNGESVAIWEYPDADEVTEQTEFL